AVEKPAAPAVKAPEKPLPLPAVEKEASSSGYSKEVDAMAEDEPMALKESGVKPAATKPAKSAPKPSVPAGFSSELADMAADAPPEGEAESSRSYSTPSFSGSSRTRRDILASLSNEFKSVDYENVDVRDVIKHLASEAKVNIIYGSDVSGPVTLHLTDVPFSEIFMTVLRIHGLVADQVGENILRIVTPATLKSEGSVAITQTRVIKLKYTMADDIKTAVDAVYKAEKRNGSIIGDKVTNSLIVTDTLDGIASIERLLAKLDVRPQQVMIEAKLIEVKLTNEVHFGIQWDYLGFQQGEALGKQGNTLIGSPATTEDSPIKLPFDSNTMEVTMPPVGAGGRGTGVSLPAKAIAGAFTFGRVTNNYWLSATLTAAASQGKVKVLSDPKIATLNGKKASINITTAIPYTTSNVASTGVTSQQVGTTTTGIKLDVTPTINADGRITLEVNPNISQPSANVTSAVAGVPAVDTREAKTTVLVHDGETIVIGGLITDSVANGVTKVPFFGDIPLIGWFFKKKSVERTRVELLIFVTTRVLPS
ncbi:MAG TPA: hypothetical protein DCM05_15865, partial [Elusimicrobia bacterium]|nr:hypothetical protein [Elusimicrobiota bacterium]